MKKKSRFNFQFFYLSIFLLVFYSCSPAPVPNPDITNVWLENKLDFCCEKALADLRKIPFDSLNIPRSITRFGRLKTTDSQSWTSGFYSGLLWQLYEHCPSNELKNAARAWTTFIEKEKLDSTTHDLGFIVFYSFGNGWKATQNKQYKDVFVAASKTLITRYDPEVKAIRSWDFNNEKWSFPVIIDNLMNLEMLFEATNITGDSTFYKIAYQHAITTLANHFRPDHSSYHVVDYNPQTGAVTKKNTHQGAFDESAWARGQAWGLYGYTMLYRYTKDLRFLNKAKAIASFFFTHPNLPEDLIPYWDFNASNIPDAERDVSAAVIAASALIELSEADTTNTQKYLKWADTVIAALEQPKYQTNKAPFFLSKSVGNKPKDSEVNTSIIYADYFYVELLERRLSISN